jgi:Yip1 domain
MSDPQEPAFQPPPPPPPPPVEIAAPRPTQLRPFAIGLFVLGVIVVIAKLMGLTIDFWTPVALAIMGLALFALSFIRLPKIPDGEAPLSPLQKLLGIFYEPTRVFRNLRLHPRWLAAYLVVAALTVVYTLAFVQRITPERIVSHTVEKVGELGSFAPPPAALEEMRTTQLEQLKNPVQKVGTVIKTFCGLFIWGGAMAALMLLATLAFGGRINYWQSLSVYFYALLPVVVVQKVLSLVILYIKSPEDLHPILNQETLVQDNLAILFTPAAHPVLFVLASFIGVLSFYGLWLRAKGVHQGGTRVSSGAAWGVAITFWVLTLLFATIVTALFPGFIS